MSEGREDTQDLVLTVSGAVQALARLEEPLLLSAAGLNAAADRGEIPSTRAASGHRVRLFKRSDVLAFAQARRR